MHKQKFPSDYGTIVLSAGVQNCPYRLIRCPTFWVILSEVGKEVEQSFHTTCKPRGLWISLTIASYCCRSAFLSCIVCALPASAVVQGPGGGCAYSSLLHLICRCLTTDRLFPSKWRIPRRTSNLDKEAAEVA